MWILAITTLTLRRATPSAYTWAGVSAHGVRIATRPSTARTPRAQVGRLERRPPFGCVTSDVKLDGRSAAYTREQGDTARQEPRDHAVLDGHGYPKIPQTQLASIEC